MVRDLSLFQDAVYRVPVRAFPWRERIDPWGILVSEFMLQQTQTERVIPYWERWMRRWPTPEALNRASLEEALREWSGLGYNRRCRYVKDCAGIIAEEYAGVLPETPEDLRRLPGVGSYTAGAVACFAYNYPAVFIETNIRSAVIDFFFSDRSAVKDAEIFPVLEAALEENRQNPRKWYWALMDYGALVKKTAGNPNRKSAGYTKQSRFEGSFRQRRGAVIRSLAFQGPATAEELADRTGMSPEALLKILQALEKESLIAAKEGIYKIADR
jgi:A/G-specific adenine glycosylase